jgi:ACT domain-containing protein
MLNEEEIRNIVLKVKEQLGPNATEELIKLTSKQAIKEIDSAYLTPQSNDLGSRIVVSVLGQNKRGILSGVTTVLSSQGCNIIDISQKLMADLFTLIMIVDISNSSNSLEQIVEGLKTEATRLGVKVYVQNEAVFSAMNTL